MCLEGPQRLETPYLSLTWLEASPFLSKRAALSHLTTIRFHQIKEDAFLRNVSALPICSHFAVGPPRSRIREVCLFKVNTRIILEGPMHSVKLAVAKLQKSLSTSAEMLILYV